MTTVRQIIDEVIHNSLRYTEGEIAFVGILLGHDVFTRLLHEESLTEGYDGALVFVNDIKSGKSKYKGYTIYRTNEDGIIKMVF